MRRYSCHMFNAPTNNRTVPETLPKEVIMCVSVDKAMQNRIQNPSCITEHYVGTLEECRLCDDDLDTCPGLCKVQVASHATHRTRHDKIFSRKNASLITKIRRCAAYTASLRLSFGFCFFTRSPFVVDIIPLPTNTMNPTAVY